MKMNALLPLALVLTASFFITACNRGATPATEPAATAEPEPMPPAPELPPPSTTAMPAAAPVDSGMDFATMDKNGDGGITHDELADTEMLHQHFDAADTDHDGKLSSAEVDAHRASMGTSPGG